MVIARSLAQALRVAGHEADIVVTPQKRFGRQASAYIATWLTDVGQSAGHPIDQVISRLRLWLSTSRAAGIPTKA